MSVVHFDHICSPYYLYLPDWAPPQLHPFPQQPPFYFYLFAPRLHLWETRLCESGFLQLTRQFWKKKNYLFSSWMILSCVLRSCSSAHVCVGDTVADSITWLLWALTGHAQCPGIWMVCRVLRSGRAGSHATSVFSILRTLHLYWFPCWLDSRRLSSVVYEFSPTPHILAIVCCLFSWPFWRKWHEMSVQFSFFH